MHRLIVNARSEHGFRRCGRFFPKGPTEIEVDDKDFEILSNEEQLFVRLVPEATKPDPMASARANAAADAEEEYIASIRPAPAPASKPAPKK